MNEWIWALPATVALIVASVGCDHKSSSEESQPEETHQSMLSLQAVDSEACPELKGTYTCTAGDKSEPVSVWIKEYSPGVPHLVFGPDNADKMDFADFLVENFAMDNGGFIADGKTHDKSEEVRKGLQYLVTVAAYTIVPPWLKSLAFDLKGELKHIDIKNYSLGYVAACRGGKVTLQYVGGNSALKAKISKTDDAITATMFVVDNGGPVVKHTETCRFTSDEVRLRKGLTESLDDLSKGATESVSKYWNYPSSMNIELADSLTLTGGKEGVTLRFDREGWITSRHIYVLNKAFLGPEDDYWFDDVEVKTPWTSIRINMETLEVTGGRTILQPEIIGKLTGESPNFKLELDSKYTQKYKSRVWEVQSAN